MRAALLLFAVLLVGCTKAQTARPCPGAPRPRCVTKVECAYDDERDCEVCRCAPPTAEPVRP